MAHLFDGNTMVLTKRIRNEPSPGLMTNRQVDSLWKASQVSTLIRNRMAHARDLHLSRNILSVLTQASAIKESFLAIMETFAGSTDARCSQLLA